MLNIEHGSNYIKDYSKQRYTQLLFGCILVCMNILIAD